MERIHGAMYEVVMRQGLSRRTVPAVSLHGIGAGRPEEGAERPATAQQREENRAPMGMSLKRGRVGARPSLKLIIGGKK